MTGRENGCLREPVFLLEKSREDAKYLEHGAHVDEVIWASLEGLLDECDSGLKKRYHKKAKGLLEMDWNGDRDFNLAEGKST